jgi:hypothetical protein
MRPEKEASADPEIWQPDWKCFCCHDRGIVHNYLAKLVIDGYDANRDKLPRCQNPGCEAGQDYDSAVLTASVDYRLTPEICLELDAIERKNWQDYVQQRRQKVTLDLLTSARI